VGAPVSLSFDSSAETFNYVHEGDAADYTLELSSFDSQGKPAVFSIPNTAVAKGDTVTFKPDWTQLTEGIGTITLRTAAGQITNRPLKPLIPVKPVGPIKPVGPLKPVEPIKPPEP